MSAPVKLVRMSSMSKVRTFNLKALVMSCVISIVKVNKNASVSVSLNFKLLKQSGSKIVKGMNSKMLRMFCAMMTCVNGVSE